jgi:hypothetical protein
MGVHHVFVAAGLVVAAASPAMRADLAPRPAAIETIEAPRAEGRPRPAAKRRAKQRITIVAAAPTLSAEHDGAAWWLDELPRLEEAFQTAFGRGLPITAYGQTALHDRLGFDHRDAIDVGLHPDSPEGLAVQSFLREAGMPFITARGSVRGVATGAHIHIGPPSHRGTAVALSAP